MHYRPAKSGLEETFGLRVCVAVLNACEFNQARRQWSYREIYIYSKLLLVDDDFFTRGQGAYQRSWFSQIFAEAPLTPFLICVRRAASPCQNSRTR
jgi:hypothetical protein